MRRVILDKILDINYTSLFSKSWLNALTPLLGSTYMFNLMAFLKETYDLIPNIYQGKGFIYPYKNRLFENFRACDFDKLKVVIIGKEPFANKNATGIPFANPFNTKPIVVEDDTILLERCVRRHVYQNDMHYLFDETMYSWSHQGVFLLDASSTSEEGYRNAHSKIWRNFTREVIKAICKNKENVIFLLWGKDAQYFKQYIGIEHSVLEYEHPMDATSKNTDWNCDHFTKVNELLIKQSPASDLIQW